MKDFAEKPPKIPKGQVDDVFGSVEWSQTVMTIIGCVVVVGVVVLFIWDANRRQQVKDTKRLVAWEARRLRADENTVHKLDVWDNKLKYEREVTETAITATVTSPGRDGKFDTKDDISSTKVNLNKSRIVGKYVGERTKRTGKAFLQGLFGDDGFEGEQKKED